MGSPLKAVVDTNIFVSSYLGSANCLGILNAFKHKRFALILSEPIKEEIRLVLTQKDLTGLSDEEVRIFFKVNEPNTIMVNPVQKIDLCRDPSDNKILEAAIAGKVDMIVTGDKGLLSLKSVEGILILTPREFLHRLKQ